MQNCYPLFSRRLLTAALSVSFSMLYVSGFAQDVKVARQIDTAGSAIDTLGRFNAKVKVSDLNISRALQTPFSNVNQLLQGNVAGLDYRRTTGEPGVNSSTLIRGTSTWFLNGKSSYYAQPTYVIDGIPLITEHPFAFDVKQYDFERMGTNTDITSILDFNDIESVRVLKNYSQTAKYGPLGVNGIIEITTKRPYSDKGKVLFNTYSGLGQQANISPTNGVFESAFRMQFYNKYASNAQKLNYPTYLSDSSQPAYYGPANWDNLYYNNSFITGNSLSISGGKQRANFSFGVGQQRDAGVADKTGLDRYNVFLKINVIPVKNLQIYSNLSGSILNRQRNKSLMSRYTEEEYLPDLTTPLSPNKDFLGVYYGNSEKMMDVNRSSYMQGQLVVKYIISDQLELKSSSAMGINDNTREYFVPASINEGNSFVSYYAGFNRRIYTDNSISYKNTFADNHNIAVTVGQTLQLDKYKYDYTKGYRGPSDFIKIIKSGGTVDRNGYVIENTFDKTMVFTYKDFVNQNLVSFYGNANYNYQNKYGIDVMLRTDGTSNLYQNGVSWFFSPSVNAYWNLKNEDFLKSSTLFNSLKLYAGYGRIGRTFIDNNNGYGTNYTVDIGWSGSQNIPSYAGIPTLSLPFSKGYVGFGIHWPYSEQFNLGLETSLFNNRLSANIELYNKTDRELALNTPIPSEYGFSNKLSNGMDVRNQGLEVTLNALAVNVKNFSWSTGIVFQTNRNKLLALPNNFTSFVSNNRKITVGQPIDNYWLLQNEGIYNSDAEVPVNPSTGNKLSYNGIPLTAGDPIWKDTNGDYVIDDNDKISKGQLTPRFAGGFNNSFVYKNLSLNVLITYALGRDIINSNMANRFDFVNREGVDQLAGIKEVTFWTKTGDYSKYPVYNPWSSVNPYQADQTLFLENGSYAKLRTATLSYDLSTNPWVKKRKISGLKIYATANNLFTITNYSGTDPELVNFMGYDAGYGMQIPKTYTLGLNLTL
ncbi:SusC/RagA family TonB-linked outer membrane protein [Pedobacter frigoris]|uniref:SusC/RagA family TonB-linked outer membrane protein n=1 Tax=Pedobacter frigoris TaxID=2571272 RepID=UPI00292D6729|nr:SusC/RagA family TonB-linked outer membrane protein [Pedobacter frigoris]